MSDDVTMAGVTLMDAATAAIKAEKGPLEVIATVAGTALGNPQVRHVIIAGIQDVLGGRRDRKLDGDTTNIIIAGSTKRKLIPTQHNKFTEKGKIYEQDDDGNQYHDVYTKPKLRRTTRTRARPSYRKGYKKASRVYKKAPVYRNRPHSYRISRWSSGAGRGVASRRYGRTGHTYGRSIYGTGRRSRQYYSRRMRYSYR